MAELVEVRSDIEAVREITTEPRTGCWAQCGRWINKGQERVRVRVFTSGGHRLFHPDCFKKWSPWDG